MNLLLLLSALLSALTGVGQAVRGARAPAVVCASMAVHTATAPQRRAVASRPAQRMPHAAEALVAVPAALRLVPAEPLFAGRRRE